MGDLVNVNGEILKPEDAQISIFDRGFLYGDSVYEVTRTYDRKIFLWKEHYARMQNSANMIGLPLPKTFDELTAQTLKVLKESNLDNAYIRWVCTRGEGQIGLDPNLATTGNFVIIVKEQKPNPQTWYDDGVSLLISGVERNAIAALDPNVKSGNYLNNLMAIKEAKEKNFFDAIMLNKQGYITEGTTFNFWIVKDNKVFTPPMNSGILKGITRDKTFEILKEQGLAFEEKLFTAEEALAADEAFITSSTKEIVPVNQLNGVKLSSANKDSMTMKLNQLFVEYRNKRLEEDNLTY